MLRHHETNMPLLKARLGLYNDNVEIPEIKGYVVASCAFFVFALSLISLLYKMFLIPQGRETLLSFVPAWVLLLTCITGLGIGVWIFFPVHTYQRYAERREQARSKKHENQERAMIKSRWESAMRPMLAQFATIFSSPYLEECRTESPQFLQWCFDTLSFGKSSFTMKELYADGSVFIDPDLYKSYRKDVAGKYLTEAKALSAIWTSKYAFGGFVLQMGSSWEKAAISLSTVGAALGIEEMVTSYYEGVPLEYILV